MARTIPHSEARATAGFADRTAQSGAVSAGLMLEG
jgi:hypothetical protein